MNMQSLMAQAQKMQRDITKKKEELDRMEFEGNSEWVSVVLYGNKTMKNINRKQKTIADQDDIEVLQDMIKIAIDDALKKIDVEYNNKMGMYSGMNGLF